jgi:excisionase family DNA binding protein
MRNELAEQTHPLLWTIRETADRLNVGRSTVYELIRAQQLEIVKIGRCTRVPSDSAEAFIRRLREPALDTRMRAKTPRGPSAVGAA